MGEQPEQIHQKVSDQDTYIPPERPEVAETIHVEEPDTVGQTARALRELRKQLSDETWVKRALIEIKEGVGVPEGYVFHTSLQEELALIPPEGIRQQRNRDNPPPPLMDEEGEMVIPKRIYASGLVWEIGKELGRGAYGRVFEVRHLGGTQRPRLVKMMMVEEGSSSSVLKRASLWNEIGALMAAGDYVQNETVHDEQGNIWTAIVMERHDGRTLHEVMKAGEMDPEWQEKLKTGEWGYKQAVALRAIVGTLRRMHAHGWVHRDIKPSNIIVNLIDKEESLSRPIDFGLAIKEGIVRQKKGTVVGTPTYLLPEAWYQNDIDLRIRDYWASVLSVGMAVGLFDAPKGGEILEVQLDLADGTYIQAPRLRNPSEADVYFAKESISGAHRAFLQWLYDFILPDLSIYERKQQWKRSGVTKHLEIPPRESSALTYLPSETAVRIFEGDFLDDDKFVRELEAHIRALAEQAGIKMPKGMLENLQEFPAGQALEERIFEYE
ncbi:hypothetical protein EPN81_02350 [Patescibacteria group bacterium]|nr:MAG: hypothetical protein EPN81_02350 [Patescibacteria group bacterium]